MVVRQLLKTACAIAAASLAAGSALAQNYPTQPIKLIVGYVPGGSPDTAARAISPKLGEILGQAVVVENRPGAGATLATAAVAKAAPDGYTLLLGETGQLVIAPFIYKTVPYNTLRDLVPIAQLVSEPVLLVSNAKSGIKTMDDLIRAARANPGKIAYGSAGIGTIHHITAEAFKAGLNLDLQHVPYKGSGQAVPALLAGDVPVLVGGYPALAGHLKAGTVNLLAVTTAERMAAFPNVPAIGEVIKGYAFPSESGILGPAALPAAIQTRLTAAIKQATESPEFHARFKDSSTVVTFRDGPHYTEALRTQLVKYEQAVKQAKIQPE